MAPLRIDGGVERFSTVTASISVTTPYIYAPGGQALAVPSPAGPDGLVLSTGAQSLSSKTLLQPTVTSGTLNSPTIVGGTFTGPNVVLTTPVVTSGSLTQPTITSGTLTSPTIVLGGSWASGSFTQPIVTSARLTTPYIAGGTSTGGTFASSTVTTSTLSSPTIVMTGGQMSGGIFYNTVWGQRNIATITTGASPSLDLLTADVFYMNISQTGTLTVANANTGKVYILVFQQGLANTYRVVSWMTGFLAAGSKDIALATGQLDVWKVLYDGSSHITVGKQTNLA